MQNEEPEINEEQNEMDLGEKTTDATNETEAEQEEAAIETAWENDSANPFCKMFCWGEENVMLLEKHKNNFEQLMYDFYQKFLGYPLWSVHATVTDINELETTSIRIYNDYVKACREQQDTTTETLYAVKLVFKLDTSG